MARVSRKLKGHIETRIVEYRRNDGHVEEMRVDAEGGAIERGAHADVGARAAAELLAFEAGARDVDAAAGKQALFGGEV